MQSRKSPLALIAVLFGALVVLLACGESSNAASVVSGTNTPSKSTPTHFKAGQAVKIGDFTVTVNSIKSSQGGQFDTLKAGDVFVVVDVTIKNNASKPQSDFSSDLQFTFTDSTGQKYNQTIIDGATPPDGTIPAAGQLRGQMSYEVPKTQRKFTLVFQPDPFGSDDQAVWDLSY